jgi:4-amino-4-deoxy-L-arabinose transferase-like glycosyltransferase
VLAVAIRANAVQADAGYSRVWLGRTVQVLAAILALRLLSLWFNTTELFFDEAQYWAWGNEPALGYFSKPPMLGWIIGLFTGICGDSEFCIRLPSPLFHTGTAPLVYLATAQLFDARTGFWAALLYATVPAVTLSATLISTDVLLLFCWAAALLAYIRFLSEDEWRWAIMLGLALGAGLMSKYAMIYFPLCLAVFALLDRDGRNVLLRGKFWVAIAIAAICLAPNIAWNIANGFVTATHTGDNIGWSGGFPHFQAFAEFFFSQFAVFGPIMFGILLAAFVRLPIEGMNRNQLLLICFSAPVLLVILFQALMSKAYANWAAVAYVSATILVADLMVNTIPEFWRRLTLSLHLGVFAVVAVAVMFARPGQLPLPESMRPFERMQGAREIAEAVRIELAGREYQAILLDDRRLSALMGYYLRDIDLPKLAWQRGSSPRDHFEMTRSFQQEPRTPAFYLTRYRNAASIVQSFEDAEFVGEFHPPAGETKLVWFYALDGFDRPGANAGP